MPLVSCHMQGQQLGPSFAVTYSTFQSPIHAPYGLKLAL